MWIVINIFYIFKNIDSKALQVFFGKIMLTGVFFLEKLKMTFQTICLIKYILFGVNIISHEIVCPSLETISLYKTILICTRTITRNF